MYPFKEIALEHGSVLREFDPDTPDDELVWHRDKENRIIKVVESGDWWLQLDNEIPIKLQKGKCHYIKAEQWHRVIKQGNKKLIVEIIKLQ